MSVLKEVEHLEIPIEEILLATNTFSEKNIIAKGGFGVVYKGQSEQHDMIAIKRLDRKLGQGDREFMMEIALLSIYKHENIVSLIGFCNNKEEKLLVYKHEKNGSLDKHLQNKDLTWVQRLQICLDAACGLKYLHDDVGPQHRIIHRDIKSSNVLLDENWKAKISDFGLSKVGPANVERTFIISNVCGTPGYVDPEYLDNFTLTKKSDVYSFGVVLFEVLCGRLAYVQKFNKECRFLSKWASYHYENNSLDEIIDSDLHKQMEPASLSVFSSIAYKCLKKHGEERPIMSEVVEQLKKALYYQQHPAEAEGSGKHSMIELQKSFDDLSSGHAATGDKARVSRTSLILAYTYENDPTAVRKLLEEDGSLVHARDYNHQTPLHVASFNDLIEVAKCLIEYGADVNALDRWKNTLKLKELEMMA